MSLPVAATQPLGPRELSRSACCEVSATVTAAVDVVAP